MNDARFRKRAGVMLLALDWTTITISYPLFVIMNIQCLAIMNIVQIIKVVFLLLRCGLI